MMQKNWDMNKINEIKQNGNDKRGEIKKKTN